MHVIHILTALKLLEILPATLNKRLDETQNLVQNTT
jgi:hypothetical protein